ncbi:acyltransferase [Rubellicoccus peritrichatus]|uniref:Acyltransferase n=1 Tax=Rubellicoccus peritrichatus TaxID=3080537 RepID=A0AAQ3LFJ4_9BACT|nr:acyltransferase [Puniceicoccus sp. CR14]WOO42910.1 acyltransferase [Puniceicoccus sp. CR14]
MQQNKSKRYHSLDIVRGVAAVSVVLSHLINYIPISSTNFFDSLCVEFVDLFMLIFRGSARLSAHPGVIVFIVLSGFCIHLPIANAYHRIKKHGFWSEYAVRRLIRIAPVYWAACLLGLFALLSWRYSSSVILPHWLSASASIDILDVIRKFGMIDPVLLSNPISLGNPALRTVATEIWLYALYPLVLAVLIYSSWCMRVIVLCLLYVATVAMTLLPMVPSGWAYESVPRFLVWWMIGVYAADWFKKHPTWGASMKGWMITILLAVVMIVLNSISDFRGAYLITVPVLALFSASLLISLLSSEFLGMIQGGVIVRAFSAIGLRSYSLYAVHMPVLGLYYLVINKYNAPYYGAPQGSAFVPLLTIALVTELFFRYIELPSHSAAKRLGRLFSKSVPDSTRLDRNT